MQFKLEIVESEKEIKDLIMNSYVDHLNKSFKRSRAKVYHELRGTILAGLQDTQEYHDLTVGILKAEFGFLAGAEKDIIDPILERIADNIRVEFTPFVYHAGRISGEMKIHMLIADFSDILGMKEAIVTPDEYGSESIPWLEWYLMRGGEVVVATHGIVFGEYPYHSRSGFAIMSEGAGPYIVPGDNSENDNWLTRYFSSESFKKELTNIVEIIIKENI